VREDPDRQGLLYAGTEFGMFISFDNGSHWQDFDLNLPNVPITDIKLHHKDLVVSTQGRSIWILDDITPLHQIAAQTSSAAAVLFKPRDAIRARLGGGRGGGGGAAQRCRGRRSSHPTVQRSTISSVARRAAQSRSRFRMGREGGAQLFERCHRGSVERRRTRRGEQRR
jgi:hypothetical protein